MNRSNMNRPNILLISADQHRADCFGFEGRHIKTPHLDQLAREGTRFSNCITPTVVCQPARASILTGQLCRTHGVHDNGIDLDPAVGEKGFAGALAASGYRTSFFGKAHFSTYHTYAPTGTPECLKSSANYPDTWHGPYMGFDYVEMMLVGHNWFLPEKPPRGQHYERWFYADGLGDEKNALYRENAGDTFGAAQTWHSRLPVAWHNSTWTADRAIEWLKRGHNNNDSGNDLGNDSGNDSHNDAPFCMWVSFPDPHHPFDAPEPWSRLHNPADVDLPDDRVRLFDGRPWWHERVLTAEPAGDRKGAEIRKAYSRIGEQSDSQLREIIANTYGQIALIDHNVGRILIALSEANLSSNTLVVYISDHGDWLGDHGLVLKGPMHYEGLLRVPLIMRGPGVPRDKCVDDPVSTIDLAPTFFDYGSSIPLLTQHGSSLRPLVETDTSSRDFALNEWELLPTRAGVGLSLRTVRTRTHKLTIDEQTGAGEMYDMINDPGETTNLFDIPEHISVRQKLLSFIASRPADAGPVRTQVGMA